VPLVRQVYKVILEPPEPPDLLEPPDQEPRAHLGQLDLLAQQVHKEPPAKALQAQLEQLDLLDLRVPQAHLE
jgi:hypothetical protein